MAKKSIRVSYELPMSDGPGGHRLGVNGLAVDPDRSILYSGGRDGVLCSWDLHLNSHLPPDPALTSSRDFQPATFSRKIQAHTHWVNDILLTQSNTALVSASSDSTVRVWRPEAQNVVVPPSIGRHNDYVKCLASPRSHADWVASGALDYKICVWDLNGGGEKLKIDVSGNNRTQKGSIYALAARGSILASGGPDNILRIWDVNSGKLATGLVGHTNNIRHILINDDGNTVITASSDQSIKVWSITAGRCMHTLTMHNQSVWSLYSDHPRLSVFYSSDRTGLVAKTDTRTAPDIDEGVCVAALQEDGGVFKVVAANDFIWTATAKSSINRWHDVDTSDTDLLASTQQFRHQTSNVTTPRNGVHGNTSALKVSPTSLLVLSNTTSADQPGEYTPAQTQPFETIEGRNGLIKHMMLNDRTRALTQDTAGDVVLWDLLRCIPIESFGKCHIDDIAADLNNTIAIANWCTLQTRIGKLSVILEPQRCFDGEIYADEAGVPDANEFRDDQRINLGKWVLRYLFSGLIDEEVQRDVEYCDSLQSITRNSASLPRLDVPTSFESQSNMIEPLAPFPTAIKTPRLSNELHSTVMTPGLSIGLATPAPLSTPAPEHPLPSPSGASGDDNPVTRIESLGSGDYFSSHPLPQSPGLPAKSPSENDESTIPEPYSPSEPDKEEKTKRSGSIFSKKFQMSFPKKIGRSSMDTKPIVEEKEAEPAERFSEEKDNAPDESLRRVLNLIRAEYETDLLREPGKRPQSRITPSPITETPLLSLPPHTAINIQEDGPGVAIAADIYRGTLETVGQHVDEIEKIAPFWLGRLLLRNQVDIEITKITFCVKPYQDLLPEAIDPDSNNNSRLSANRMLRAKKILAYVAERIDPQYSADNQDETLLKPEEYLELYCQNTLVSPNMTLLTMRTHIWRAGGDMILYYKANGKRTIPMPSKDEGPETPRANNRESGPGVDRGLLEGIDTNTSVVMGGSSTLIGSESAIETSRARPSTEL